MRSMPSLSGPWMIVRSSTLAELPASWKNSSDGLSRFKKGFSNRTVPSYVCGKVLDPVVYRNLSAGVGASAFFRPIEVQERWSGRMQIRGKVVTLRAIEEADLPALHRWANDPDLWTMLGGWHFPTSLHQTRQWFESLSSNPLNQRFAIDVPGAGLIGTANLVDIDWKNNNAFHGMMIGDPSMRGKGIGVDVTWRQCVTPSTNCTCAGSMGQ